jgi:hypothetical protein
MADLEKYKIKQYQEGVLELDRNKFPNELIFPETLESLPDYFDLLKQGVAELREGEIFGAGKYDLNNTMQGYELNDAQMDIEYKGNENFNSK